MKKFHILTLIFLIFAVGTVSSFGYGEEYISFCLVISEGGRVLLKEDFILNPEFVYIAKGKQTEVLCELKKGFSDKELLNYLFYDAGDRAWAIFDELDNVKIEDCITLSGDKFYFFPERSAQRVDRRAFFDAILNGLNKNECQWEVAFSEAESKYSLSELKQCTSLIAHYSTYYSSSAMGRKHNISLASKFISGSAIGAGETFSFNKTVGRRVESRGFKGAKVIQDGVFTEGVGGGVCQVATTLYNATLRAGLTPVQVARHTLAPSYVPLSFDAMVSESTDLKIKNPGDAPVFLWLTADGERLTAKVYGKSNPDVTYKFESETVAVLKHEEMKEECAELFRDGYKSKGYKLVYEKGILKEKILIRTDTYKPYRIAVE